MLHLFEPSVDDMLTERVDVVSPNLEPRSASQVAPMQRIRRKLNAYRPARGKSERNNWIRTPLGTKRQWQPAPKDMSEALRQFLPELGANDNVCPVSESSRHGIASR